MSVEQLILETYLRWFNILSKGSPGALRFEDVEGILKMDKLACLHSESNAVFKAVVFAADEAATFEHQVSLFISKLLAFDCEYDLILGVLYGHADLALRYKDLLQPYIVNFSQALFNCITETGALI